MMARRARREGVLVSDTLRDGEPLLRPWLPVDLLDNAARTISENKAVMLGLPVLGGILVSVAQLGLAQLTVPGGLPGLFDPDPNADDGNAGTLVLMYGGQLVLYTIAATMLSGVIAIAAVRSQLGARVGAGELLRLVRPSLLPLLGVGVVQALVLMALFGGWFGITFGTAFGVSAASSAAAGLAGVLLFLAGIPLAVIVGTRLSLAGTIVLMEGRRAPDLGLYVPARVGVGGALKRSWRLIKGRFWRSFGILLFAGVVVTIVGYVIQSGLVLLVTALSLWVDAGGQNGTAFAISVGVAALVGAGLATIASLSFVSAVLAMLYLDLRVRREGLDLWLRPVLQQRSGPR
jgi:hypothetical protein